MVGKSRSFRVYLSLHRMMSVVMFRTFSHRHREMETAQLEQKNGTPRNEFLWRSMQTEPKTPTTIQSPAKRDEKLLLISLAICFSNSKRNKNHICILFVCASVTLNYTTRPSIDPNKLTIFIFTDKKRESVEI